MHPTGLAIPENHFTRRLFCRSDRSMTIRQIMCYLKIFREGNDGQFMSETRSVFLYHRIFVKN